MAPVGYIVKHLCKSVDHYVATNDWLTTYYKNNKMEKCMDTIHYIEPQTFWDENIPLATHSMQNEIYRDFIKTHIKEHYR